MATIDVKDAAGVDREVELPNANGRADAAASRPTVWANEDLAKIQELIDAMTAAATSLTTIQNDTTPATITSAPGDIRLLKVTLSTDTAAMAVDEVLAETQVIAGAFKQVDGTGLIKSLVLVDQADLGQAIDFFFLDANVSMGTENAAPSITDANAINIIGKIEILTTDYEDLGGVKVAFKSFDGIVVKAAPGTADLYVAAILRSGAPTYAADSLRAAFGILN